MADRNKQARQRWPLGPRGLGIVLAVLFFGTWVGQYFVQMIDFGNEAREHGQAFTMSDYLPAFWQATLENWQSEFLQLLSFVVLTSFLVFRGSPESRDSEDQMQAALERIEARLDEIEIAVGARPGGGRYAAADGESPRP